MPPSTRSQDAIAVLEPDLTIVAWNRAAERRTGVSAAEAIGQPLDGILASRTRTSPTSSRRRSARASRATGFWSGRVTEHIRRGPSAERS
jgi:PAS domain S-box-containing protein